MIPFDYASIRIMSPHKIEGYSWDDVPSNPIEANIKLSSKNKSDVESAIEHYLVQNNYLPKNYRGITLCHFPNSSKEDENGFYIQNPGENALDEIGRVYNCFAVVVVQTGVQNAGGYYSSHPFLTPLDIWGET